MSRYIDSLGAAILVLAIVLMGFLHALIGRANKRAPQSGATAGHGQRTPPPQSRPR